MRGLESLKEYVDHLSSPGIRITERRKYVGLIQDQLNLDATCRKLSDAFEENADFCWMTIFELAKRLADEELLRTKKLLSNTREDPNTTQRKRASTGKTVTPAVECFNFFKQVVAKFSKAVDFGFPTAEVSEFCFRAFRDDDEELKRIYSRDTVLIVSEHVLCHPSRYCNLNAADFNSLINSVCDLLLLDESPGPSISNALKAVVSAASSHYDALKVRNMRQKMRDLFEHFKKKQAGKRSWENLMSCANILLETYGFDRRIALCEFGERISDKIIAFHDFCSDQSLQEEITKFFCFQFILHHPKNAMDDKNGAISDDAWMAVVKELYQRLISDISKIQLKQMGQRKTNASLLSPDVLDLACRVLCQVFSNTDFALPASSSRLEVDVPSPAFGLTQPARKRQCVETGWNFILAIVKQRRDCDTCKAWLEIIEHFVSKFGACLSNGDTVLIAKELVSIADSFKRPDILRRVLNVLRFAVSRLSSTHSEDCAQLCALLCPIVRRLIASRPVQIDAISLMSAIVHSGFYPSNGADVDLVQALGILVTDVKQECLDWIQAVLVKCDFNERLLIDGSGIDNAAINRRYSFRLCLIDWLLTPPRFLMDDTPQDRSAPENTCNFVWGLKYCSPAHLAKILSLLLCDKPAKARLGKGGSLSTAENRYQRLERQLADFWCLDRGNEIDPDSSHVRTDDGVMCIDVVADRLIGKLEPVLVSIIDSLQDKDVITVPQFKNFIDHWCFQWSCSMCFGSMYTSSVPAFQRLYDLNDRFWDVITKTTAKLKEAKRVFVQRVADTLGILLEEEVRIRSDLAPHRLIYFLYSIAENEFDVYGSPRKQRQQTDESLLLPSLAAFGMALAFSCRAGDLTSTSIPNTCRDFLDVLRESPPVDFSTTIIALEQVGHFFRGDPKNDNGIATAFLEVVRTLIAENHRSNIRTRQLVGVLEPLACWAASIDGVKEGYIGLLCSLASGHDGSPVQHQSQSSVIDAGLKCLRSFLQAGDGSRPTITLDRLLKLLGGSFRLDYSISLASTLMIKDVKDFEKVVDAYFSLLKKEREDQEEHQFVSICLTITVCKTMAVDVSFHAPCLVKLAEASKKGLLNQSVCKALLRQNFGSKLSLILKENLDVILSYWMHHYGTNFGNFPYWIWNETSVDHFLNSNFARLIPLATTVLNSLELNSFLARFNDNNVPDKENVATEMAAYTLAVVAFNQSPNHSTPLEFLHILKDDDVKNATLECMVDTLCILCQWTVFERPVILGTIEQNHTSWLGCLERLIKMAGCSNLSETLNILPERSIPKLLVSLRCCALRSQYKRRWMELLELLLSRLDLGQLDIDLRRFIAREALSLASALLRDVQQLAEARMALKAVQGICDYFYRGMGEEIAEYLADPLASIASVLRRINGLHNDVTMENVQSLVNVMKTSNNAWQFCPLVTSWPAIREQQMEVRGTWDARTWCRALLEMRPWMLTGEELQLAGSRLAELCKAAVDSDPLDSYAMLARKLLSLLSAENSQFSDQAIKLLAVLHANWPSATLQSFLYSWNFKESQGTAILSILDECFRSDDAELIRLAADTLVLAIDLIPAVKSAICEENGKMDIYRALVPKKDCFLKTLDICRSTGQEFPSSTDKAQKMVRSVCRSQAEEAEGCCEFLQAIERLLLYDVITAERLLPYVIEYSITRDKAFANSASKIFNELLKPSADLLEGSNGREENYIGVVRCILGCVQRLQRAGIKRPGMECYRLLDLDYIQLANAAVACGLPSAAPLFMEIGTESLRTPDLEMRYDLGDGCNGSLLSEMVIANPIIETALVNSYVAQADAEALEGLGDVGIKDTRARILMCEMDGDITKLISLYSSVEKADEILPWHAIFSLSFCRKDRSNRGMNAILDSEYSCAWKLCQWDAFDQSKMTKTGFTFNRLVYDTIKDIAARHAGGYSGIRDHLSSIIGQCSVSPQVLLRQIILVDDLETALSAVGSGQIEEFLASCDHDRMEFDERVWLRHAIANRLLFSPKVLPRVQPSRLAQRYTPICCQVLSLCGRKNLRHIGLQVVQNSKKSICALFENQPNAADEFMAQIEIREVDILWEFKEYIQATNLLKSLINRLEKSSHKSEPEILCSLTKCYVLLNDFKGHGNVADSSLIADKLAEMARLLQIASRNNSSADVLAALGTAHLAVANFANRKYQEISDYINSAVFAAKKSHIEKLRSELRNVEGASRSSSPLPAASVEQRTYMQVSKKKCDVDESEVSDLNRRRNSHLVAALTSYLNVLALCNDHDVLIFRAVSLWFDNLGIKEVTKVVEKLSPSIKTCKWLVVFPQLASRLSSNEPSKEYYSKTIREIVSNVLSDHPFHTFYTLRAMAIAEPRDDIEKRRQAAAQQIISRALSGPKGAIFKHMERLIDAFLSLHDWKPASRRRECEIPNNQPILSLLGAIPLPTMSIEPMPSCDYGTVPKISKFDNRCRVMSGMSTPKRITCLCSDGIGRRFLLKGGQDDPRQDAIMEQLFRIVNIRLQRKERESGSYQGQYGVMRTYNVVPLSSSVGLIENCDGCISLGDYLLGEDGKAGARLVYYPNEILHLACRQQIVEASKDCYEFAAAQQTTQNQPGRPGTRSFVVNVARLKRWKTKQRVQKEQVDDPFQQAAELPDRGRLAPVAAPTQVFVWATRRGHPPFPGKIIPAQQLNREEIPGWRWVKFFDEARTLTTITTSRIQPYMERRAEYEVDADAERRQAMEACESAMGLHSLELVA